MVKNKIVCGVLCAATMVVVTCDGVWGMMEDASGGLSSDLSQLSPITQSPEQEVGTFSRDDVTDEDTAAVESGSSIVDVAHEFCENLQMPTEETMVFLTNIPEFAKCADNMPWMLFNNIAGNKNSETVKAAILIEKAICECTIYSIDQRSSVGKIIHQSSTKYDMLLNLGESFMVFDYDNQLLAIAQMRHYSINPVEYQTKNSYGRLECREYCDLALMSMADDLYNYFFWRIVEMGISE
jgi:hypothetical protein